MFDRLGRKDQRKPGPYHIILREFALEHLPIAASFVFAGYGHILRFFESQYRFEA